LSFLLYSIFWHCSKDTPIFVKVDALKALIRDFLQEKAKEGKITYTILKNGSLFDMREYFFYIASPSGF